MVVLLQPLLMIGASSNTNIFTAMLGTIIIGMGIDYSVHMSERIHQEGTNFEGIARSTRGTRQSMVQASATTIMGVTAGIGVTLYSFAGLRNFFVIISVLLFYSLLAGLLVLPAIYAVISGYHKYGGLNQKALGVPWVIGKEEEKSFSEHHTEREGEQEEETVSHKPGISILKGKQPTKAVEVQSEPKILDAESIDWEDAEILDDDVLDSEI